MVVLYAPCLLTIRIGKDRNTVIQPKNRLILLIHYPLSLLKASL